MIGRLLLGSFEKHTFPSFEASDCLWVGMAVSSARIARAASVSFVSKPHPAGADAAVDACPAHELPTWSAIRHESDGCPRSRSTRPFVRELYGMPRMISE